MKKLLFLTALFTTLFIGLTACSDKEEEIIDLEIEVSPATPPENITFRVFYNESDKEYTLNFYESAETRLWIKLFGDTTVLGLECASKEVEDSIAKYVGGVIACDKKQ